MKQQQPRPYAREGPREMTARFALTEHDGFPNYAMRVMEFEPEGYTCLRATQKSMSSFSSKARRHWWTGSVTKYAFRLAIWFTLRRKELHQIRNIAKTRMRVSCTILILPCGDGKSTTAQTLT